jgi:hypothetical protein
MQPPIPRALLLEAVNAFAQYKTKSAAAQALKIPRPTLTNRLNRAELAGIEADYKEPPKAGTGRGKRVLVIPDMHAPFQHPDTIPFLRAAKDKFNPDRVVCLGDETDQHALSQHDPDPDGFSAGHEHLAALDALRPLYELFPVMAVCTSNHGERIFKRAYRANIPVQFLKDYIEFMDAPKGWQWSHKFEIDGVVYEHGEGVSGQLGALKKAMGNMKSTVIGHLHADAGVLFLNNGEKQIFAMNCGCMINVDAYAFKYGKNSMRKPVIAIGIVDKGVPQLVPMQMDANKRWTGKI